MPNTILKRWNGSAFEELYPKTTVGQISASGTPSSTTFLRGDGQWASPAGGGDVVGPASSTTGNVPQFADTTGKLINGGKAINDSSSASAISTGTNLVTERDIYYGLPTINNSHTYTSSTTIYAPTTGQTSDYLLAGNGTTSAPVWRFNKAVWETADQSLTAATDVLSITIPAAGTYKVFMTGAYYSTSTTIGVQVKFTYSGTLSTTPDSSFNITVSLNNAASSGDFHNEVPMNTAVTSTSVAAINTNHGMSALGQFTTTNGGTFSLNIAPETGTTSVGVAEGTLLHVEQVI